MPADALGHGARQGCFPDAPQPMQDNEVGPLWIEQFVNDRADLAAASHELLGWG